MDIMAYADLGAGSALFTVEAMVRGYHVYKDVWSAALGEQLSCQREPTNTSDPFAVAVVRSLVTVGQYTQEDIFNMLHVSSTGWDDHLSSDSIQALLWRFTPRRTRDPLPADIQRDHERHRQDH